MFPVPGSDQICIDGDDSVIGAENHAASSFYQFWQDEEGRWHIRCDADGNTALIPGTREDSMVYLHEFTTFIINVMPEDERERAGALSLLPENGGPTSPSAWGPVGGALAPVRVR